VQVHSRFLAVIAAVALASCGGSSGSSDGGGTPSTTTYAIGGTISGLTGSGLVLSSPGQANLTVAAGATTFTFGTRVASGTAYAVSVAVNPSGPAQACTVTNGSGTVGSADVSNIAIACGPAVFSIGGTVSGLTGSGLVLATTGQANLPVAAGATTFAFATKVDPGTAYSVTVVTQPTNPTQTCTVASGSGTVGSADVSNVAVTCATAQYSVGGTVIGLQGSGLVLASPGLPDLSVPASATTFTFGTPAPSGTAYTVTVKTQPSSPVQSCTVSAGTGTVASDNVTSVIVNCSANQFLVGGTITGLTGTGLVLQTSGQADLTVQPNAQSFAFGATVATGTAYAVTVKTQPSSPTQTCSVTNGSGTVGSTSVTNIVVTCSTNTYTLGGTISGLAGSGLQLASTNLTTQAPAAGATSFSFGTLPSGTAYGISVATQPTNPSQTCVVANGNGTIGASAPANVTVTCTTNTYALGGTITGLTGTGLQLASAGLPTQTVAAGAASFNFGAVPSGTAYAVTVATQPTAPLQSCTVTNGNGTVTTGAVSNVTVTCTVATVIQSWAAPATWGGSSFWSDSEQGMVEHGVATATGFQESKFIGSWTTSDTIAHTPFGGFGPGVSRYGAGPFLFDALANPIGTALKYQATAGDNVLNISGPMLTCAVIQPDWNPVDDGYERVILAKGKQGESGWVLMQMHEAFCFHYQYGPNLTDWTMNWTASGLADNMDPRWGPNNLSLVVVCGGRVGDQIVVGANNAADTLMNTSLVPQMVPVGSSLYASSLPATIGAYATPDAQHRFAGTVYETAVWAIPATEANVQAKMSAVLATRMADGTGLRYYRDREGPWLSPDGHWYTQARHGPRLDAANGLIFGLQGTNRIAYPQSFAIDRTPTRWTASSGAVTVGGGSVGAPYGTTGNYGNNADTHADEIMLPVGASISTQLGNFLRPGGVQGQIWLYPHDAASRSLRISSVMQPGTTSQVAMGTQDVTLGGAGGLPTGQWSRVYIDQLSTLGLPATTAPVVTTETFFITNTGSSAVRFSAWGATLTQLDSANAPGGGASNIGFDPGPAMYSSLATGGGDEFLELPTIAITESTATTGFCLSVDLRPAVGMEWATDRFNARGLVSWQSDTTSAYVDLTYYGADLTLRVSNGTSTDQYSVSTPGTWTADGTFHNVKACVAANGFANIYMDNVQRGSGAALPVMSELAGGKVRVGSSSAGHWHGYVKKAAACRLPADPANISACQ
jgi:environmental stress-induced protein Ves